jgi:hypothetical protein
MRAFLFSVMIGSVACSGNTSTESPKPVTHPQQEPSKNPGSDEAAAWKRCAGALRAAGQTSAAERIDQYANALTMHPFQGGPGSEGSKATDFVRNSAHQVAATALASLSEKPADCQKLQ